jgi:Prenyltransferase and squalene oxidase repeat
VELPWQEFGLHRCHAARWAVVVLLIVATLANAQAPIAETTAAKPPATTDDTPANVLSPAEWRRVDAAVDRALAWLATQQQPDGSFPTLPTGQPGVTSLSLMAFVSHGHLLGEGMYGQRLEQATDFVLSCQKDNGLLTLVGPDGSPISRAVELEVGTCAAYNHAIGALSLSELYGMCGERRAERVKTAIDKALVASLEMQRWPKDRAVDRGGWRYLAKTPHPDSDLSITGWELMFLRSARNAGFDVPKQPIDEAVAYVRRSYNDQTGAFEYFADFGDHRSRGMAGAGILALAHAGFHGAPEAQRSGEWLLRHDFDEYNVFIQFGSSPQHDRYHYGLLNCCQGMYQLGGRYWAEFFPRVVRTLLANQQADGSWPADTHWHDGQFGNAYTTALVVITLGAPNQLLPIFQR